MAYKKDENTVRQHTAVYTPEDKQAFADKDKRISKLSVLKCAVDIYINRHSDAKDDNLPVNKIEILSLADELLGWVYDVNKNIPVPLVKTEAVKKLAAENAAGNKIVDNSDVNKLLQDMKLGVLTESISDKDIPPFILQPTDAEKKIIYQVAHVLNDKLVEKGDKRVVDVKKLVDWIYKTYGRYPTQEKSIDKILANKFIETCLIENSFTKGLTK